MRATTGAHMGPELHYNFLNKPRLDGVGAERPWAVENHNALVVRHTPEFARFRLERVLGGCGGGFSFPRECINPFVVEVVPLDPPAVSCGEIWSRTNCGFGGRMDCKPYLKLAGHDAYVPLDVHVQLRLVGSGGAHRVV